MSDKEENQLPVLNFKLRSLPAWTTTQQSSGSLILWNQPVAPAEPIEIVKYESDMLVGLIDARAEIEELDLRSKRTVINALTESALLHARTLCAIFLSEGREAEIKLETLLAQFSPTEEQRRAIYEAIHQLEDAYGEESDHNSPRFIINSMVMHPTVHRGDYGVYDGVVNKLVPLISQVMSALQAMFNVLA